MDVSVLSRDARLVLAIAAVVLGLAALALRWRRAREVWVVAFAVAAAATVLALALERAVALAAVAYAPSEADFNEWRWVLLSPWGRPGIAAGAAVALATIALAWRGTARERSTWRRALLVALRAGACAAALVLFLEPALELRHVRREPNHVVVLVDDSRSMKLAENAGGETRARRAAGVIAASAATFDRWREDHHLDFFTFSELLAPAAEADLAREVSPRADATLLGESLDNVRRRFEGGDLAGVVVVSDGVPTGRLADGVDSGAMRDFLASLRTRVHTVWAGRDGLADVSVARVEADEFAFVRTVVKIEAVVRVAGLPRRTLLVHLERDGVVVREQAVTVGGDSPEARVAFTFTPERVGKYVYQVSVPVDPAEAVPSNNARAFVLRVLREKMRVLLVAGRPSPDERDVRRLLKSNPNVDLISFFILRTWDDVQSVNPSELSLIPFPTQELFEEELGSFDAILLMNFEYGPYAIAPYLENLRRFVDEGGGLAMVGGDLAFSSGRYQETPVADVLPVRLLPAAGPPESLVSTEEFSPRLTPEGRRHPITQLRPGRRDNEGRWNTLPPLEGLNLTAGAKPGASVLATHPFLRTASGAPMPVIVTGERGKGRALAVMTDTLWRWGFLAAGRPGDDGRAFQRFWDNALRWLVHDPEFDFLRVQATQPQYPPGETPRVRVRLVDADYVPAAGKQVVLTLARAGAPAGGASTRGRGVTTDAAGEAELDLEALPPGAYRVTGRARAGDREVTGEDVFLVDPQRAELERPEARQDVLRGIAEATGGRYLGPASSLPASLPFAPPRVVRVDRRTDVELWSRPYLLVLALTLLGAEWSLRRKRGYL